MRHALTLALQVFSGAIVLISHDKHLLRSITDQYWLVDHGLITPFDGDLDDYHQWLLQSSKAESQTTVGQPGTSQSKKEQRQQAAARRHQLKPLTSKLQKIEKELEKLQHKQEVLEQKLAQSAIYEDQHKPQLALLLQEKGELDNQHEALEETWFEISEQLQEMEQAL
jgi:ATP-binding cassette subfamily F protein 3